MWISGRFAQKRQAATWSMRVCLTRCVTGQSPEASTCMPVWIDRAA